MNTQSWLQKRISIVSSRPENHYLNLDETKTEQEYKLFTLEESTQLGLNFHHIFFTVKGVRIWQRSSTHTQRLASTDRTAVDQRGGVAGGGGRQRGRLHRADHGGVRGGRGC